MPSFPDADARARSAWAWDPPAGALRVVTVDAHTEGEPLRVILAGFPELGGATIRERRLSAQRDHDDLRRALMWEPRGHADMYGAIVTPPERPGSDLGVVFTHNAGYSTMCGHGVLALARVAVELELVPAAGDETEVRMDTPAGPVTALVRTAGEAAPDAGRRRGSGRVAAVSFRNVPSWAEGLDRSVTVEGWGRVAYDLAFGGAFYAYVDAAALGLELGPRNVERLVAAGRAIKEAVARSDPPVHPEGQDLSFVYGTIFTGRPNDPSHHSRHVCVFADGEVDRSPTGTGVSGRLAILRARDEVAVGQSLVIESIIGSRFACRIVEEGSRDGRAWVVPEVEGRVHVTGRSEWILDPADPLGGGFLVR